jgi:hypothetical protein
MTATTRDVITVICDPNNILGKRFTVADDGTVTKKVAVPPGFALAKQHHIPDAAAMRDLLRAVGEDPHLAIINSVFSKIPLNERFAILSEDQFKKRLQLEDRHQILGVHEVEHEGETLKAVARFKENMLPSSWQLLDRDVDDHTPEQFAQWDRDDWIRGIDQLLPGISSASLVCSPSTSSRVWYAGRPVGGGNGHVWFQVVNPDDVSRLRQAILPRAVERGLFWKKPKLARLTGQVVAEAPTTIIDTATLLTGRLVFSGKPDASKDLEVVAPEIDVLNADVGPFDTVGINLPTAGDYRRIMAEAGLEMRLRSKEGATSIDSYDLRYDTELELQDGRILTVRDVVHDVPPAGKIRCQTPFRESASFAAFLRLGKDGRPCLHDVGTGTSHWLRDVDFTQDYSTDMEHQATADKPVRSPRSALEILNTTFKPIMWTLENLLPEGLFLLCAGPKVGKSWMSLQMALATASGGTVLGERATEGDALVLALEDNDRRLQSRLTKLDAGALGAEALGRVQFETEWPRVDQGGAARIGEWLDTHPNARLVVVDVLERVRTPRTAKGNGYGEDYAALKELKGLTDDRRITILVVHHTRKATSDDAMQLVSGTQGLTGAADGVLVLERPRGAKRGTLHIMARDLEREGAFVVEFDGGRWSMIGSASEVASTEGQQEVVDLLRARGEALGPSEIAKALGKSRQAVQQMLKRMVDDGLVRSEPGGKYASAEDLEDLEDLSVATK